jgi:hypothetical protein
MMADLSPHARAQVQRVLAAAARRLLAERLTNPEGKAVSTTTNTGRVTTEQITR